MRLHRPAFPVSLALSARSWILGIPSFALITQAGLQLASISHAGIGESCYQNPHVDILALPAAGWIADGVFSFFAIAVQCSYFTSRHALLLVRTQARVWDWEITCAGILGLLGVTLFLTARLATRQTWNTLPRWIVPRSSRRRLDFGHIARPQCCWRVQ